jgi:hypothetical protein
MKWQHVVFALVCGATLFGCIAIEPIGTLLLIAGVVWLIFFRGGDDE